MTLKIIIVSIILVALAVIGLAVKYYNTKRAHRCYRNSEDEAHREMSSCESCGAELDDECKVDD